LNFNFGWVKTSGSGSGFGTSLQQFAYSLFFKYWRFNFTWNMLMQRLETGVNLNDNLWHHVVLVFDSGTFYL
jgi:hypothetical protein